MGEVEYRVYRGGGRTEEGSGGQEKKEDERSRGRRRGRRRYKEAAAAEETEVSDMGGDCRSEGGLRWRMVVRKLRHSVFSKAPGV